MLICSQGDTKTENCRATEGGGYETLPNPTALQALRLRTHYLSTLPLSLGGGGVRQYHPILLMRKLTQKTRILSRAPLSDLANPEQSTAGIRKHAKAFRNKKGGPEGRFWGVYKCVVEAA